MKSLILPPLSALYSAVTRTRLSLYQRGTFRTTKLDRPVISVGNMTVGGTGKTPLVELVSKIIGATGKKVCILTRGYGRQHPERQVIVSDGQAILATPAEAGDEPYLLATNLLGLAAVICSADRVSAGRDAIEVFGTECFVLDDGFQHLRLARDLNIVTVDATNPWGSGQLLQHSGGGQLLPHGRLREPLSGLSRADCLVLTRCDQVNDLEPLRKQIQSLIGFHPLFPSTMKPRRSAHPDGPVAAFCAVGNPQSFFAQLKDVGYAVVAEKAFRDHHIYTQKDIDDLTAAATRAGAKALITTAKDAVKLRSLHFSLPYSVFEIEIAIEDEELFKNLILKAAEVAWA
ncbi:MAG TPA: tetraacyldisaccharide 4'-kinase [Pyrinomonadaceae bacterium]|nr:tetraacyldisaccharide 4'-kinase [Pyrinomonadaceae bacterium]